MKRLLSVLLIVAMPEFVAAAEPPPSAATLEVAVGKETATFRKISPRSDKLDYPDFYFLETEVTNRLYREYLRASGEHKDDLAFVAARTKELRALRERSKAARREEKLAAKITGPVVKPPVTSAKDRNVTRVEIDVDLFIFDELSMFEFALLDRGMLWSRDEFPQGTDDHPVAYLMPSEAAALCTWLTKQHPQLGLLRLPTWNEWMIAAYGRTRAYPWGNDWNREKVCTSHGREDDDFRTRTEPVKNPFRGRTPEGLYGMLGNVSEYLVSGDVRDGEYFYLNARWMGGGFQDGDRFSEDPLESHRIDPREDYWGYRHESDMRAQDVGFRVVLDPTNDPELIVRPPVFGQRNNNWRTEVKEEGSPRESSPTKATVPADGTSKTPATPGR